MPSWTAAHAPSDPSVAITMRFIVSPFSPILGRCSRSAISGRTGGGSVICRSRFRGRSDGVAAACAPHSAGWRLQRPRSATSSSATAARCGCARRDRGRRARPCSTSSADCRSGASTGASTAFPSLTPATVEPFLDPDWEERGSLIGALSDGGGERIVALASFVRLRDPSSAEVAFAVADELQGRGVGHAPARAARRLGRGRRHLRRSSPRSCRTTVRCSASSQDAGFAVSRRLEGGTTEVRLAIAADGELPRGGRRARPRRRRGVARPLLLAADGRRRRRLDATRLDRRRALPQHSRRRLRRDRLPRQPQGGLGRGREGVPVDRGHPRRRRPGRLLPCPAPPCSTRQRRRFGRGRAPSVSSPPASPRPGSRASAGRTSCSPSCAPTARVSSGRTASASSPRRSA